MVAAMSPPDSPPQTDETIAAIDQILEGNDTKALSAIARGMENITCLTQDELSGIKVPVLAIAGEFDGERGNLEKMVGVAPDVTFKLLPGKNHMEAVSDPLLKSSIVEFFLAQR